ncbi:MAG: DUF2254 domain-containing protein [Vicinamibacterales bacterium]
MTRLRAVWDRMRGTYWAVPSAMAALSVVLSLVMIDVDQALTAKFLSQLSWVYTGGPQGARAVLSTIAASMITVAGVTFSITIVALTLASQQFGPRLLRNFLRDLGNQITLGTFIATFLYCLLVLRTVRGTDDTRFVPHLAVTVGVVLAMLSIGVLIFFIHHIATSIQASQVIANVAGDLEGAIERLFPDRIGRGPGVEGGGRLAATSAPTFDDARTVTARRAGYVQAVDIDRLLTVARRADAVIRIDATPGRFVRTGSPLASVVLAAEPTDDLDDSLRDVFLIGADRTGTQDVGFFINQLVELAVRALSPGINDPATARTCIDRLEQALCLLASRRLPSPYRHDDDGVLRVVAAPVTFVGMLDLALTEVTRYGRSSVSVSSRVLEAIRDLAPCVSAEDDRLALIRQAFFAGDRPADSFDHEMDRVAVAESYRAALAAIHDRLDSHYST